MVKKEILLKGGTLVTAESSRKADILIKDGLIAAIGENLTPDDLQTINTPHDLQAINTTNTLQVIDITGAIVTRGFTDLHVHFREPGFEYKETIRTGSMAAARGGYTTVCTMPNLNPVPDTIENLKKEQDIIDRDAIIEVLPYASITKGRKGLELVDIPAMKTLCPAFSDDGSGVQDDAMMLKAMTAAAENGAIIAAHCEDNKLLKGGYIHDGKYAKAHGHKGICSESEWGQIARDIELAEKTGCRYHVCHISTAESVELIRQAKARGVKVTCETGPHYLALCEDDLQEDGRFKMNPPLRSAADREALIEGLIDGTIDAIATDHAPHSAEEKSRGLEHSAMGIVGIETAFPVVYTTLVKTGRLTLNRLVAALTTGPRRAFNLRDNNSTFRDNNNDSYGDVYVGGPADLAVIDIDNEYTINPDDFLSMGHSTPFSGMSVLGRTLLTLKSGQIAFCLGNFPSQRPENDKNVRVPREFPEPEAGK